MAGQVLYKDVNEGDSIPEFATDPLSEIQFVRYAGASGDFNPLHTVHAFGEMVGYGGVIGHGMLSMALTGRALTNWLGHKALKKFAVNFRAVTLPKDVLTVKGTVTKKYEESGQKCIDIDFVTENQRGEKVIMGNATAALP
ncbi:MAG: MaoC/PaaZ C-terminal domain-containing protein [Thermodesulfobacteriota bacterium]|nr:MaoC/PaaZ C-terminal domain-containing protein [Thermodesulfobacteriota bacterium]